MVHKRRTSNVGLALIKDHEGLSLVAYQDPVGVWTIGYGHTKTVVPGAFITKEIAHTLLLEDVQEAETCVYNSVKVPISQSMFDALVSFIFNLGCTKFRNSTLLKLLNEGNYLPAADEFPRWRLAGGRILPGLVRRRAMEQALFLSNLSLIHNYVAGEIYEYSREQAISSYYISSSPHSASASASN